MEETVRSLLQNQGILEQTAVDTVDIMKAYKVNYRLICLFISSTGGKCANLFTDMARVPRPITMQLV